MNIVQLPTAVALDIPEALRRLADDIEVSGATVRLAWVAEGEAGDIDVGLLGQCPAPGPTAYMLLGMGQRRLEME